MRSGCNSRSLLARGARLGVAWLALAAPALAGVLIVDPNGFGDYRTIQAGIDAAGNGDIVLVRPIDNCCETATIAGKSLTLVADVGAGEPTARLDLTISGVPAGGQVVVRGFRPTTTASSDSGILLVQDCAGAVWIEDCAFKGEDFFFFVQTGAEVRNSSAVSFTRCVIAGSEGMDGNPSFPPSPGAPGANGVLIVDSTVAFHECVLTAGDGGGSTFYGGADGGHGVELQNSLALLSGCTVSGGDAGFGGGGPVIGHGLLVDATSAAHLLDDSITPGFSGVAIEAPPGAVVDLSGSERSLEIPAPKREGQGGLMVVSGEMGDVVGFFWSIRGGAFPLLAKNGWLLLDPALLAGPFPLASIGSPSGELNVLFNTPSLPAAAQAMVMLVQPFFSYVGGTTLGGGTACVILDLGL